MLLTVYIFIHPNNNESFALLICYSMSEYFIFVFERNFIMQFFSTIFINICNLKQSLLWEQIFLLNLQQIFITILPLS